MPLNPKAVALAASFVAALGAATLAQAPRAGRSANETLALPGYIDWVEKSDVSALQEGVIDKMELKVGNQVKQGGVIGTLHMKKAELTAAKAKLAAKAKGGIMKANAQKELALADLARLINLNQRGTGFVAKAEMQKAEAEVKVGEANVVDAEDNTKLAEADLALADRAVDEHTIKAPFDGVITVRMKNPGENVNAREPVVQLVKVDTLKFYGDLPIESSYKVKVGDLVDVQPEVEGADLPIERKKFRGKITFVSPEIVSVNKTVVSVYAEVANNGELELRAGLKALMTIYLGSHENPAVAPPPPADMLKESAVNVGLNR